MTINLTKLTSKYKGKWVGLQPKSKAVIASGESVSEVIEKSRKKGFNKPILFRVPTKIVPYIGVAF